MAQKRVIAVKGGTGLVPNLVVEDDDTSPADVSAAIAAHAALVSGVHGLNPAGGGTPINADIYIDGVTGLDTNTGLSKAAPLQTLAGYYARYGTELPLGSTVRIHLAGTGGADPWETPNASQDYARDVVDVGSGSPIGNMLVFRGPTDMVLATLLTGPSTGLTLDPDPVGGAVPCARIVNAAGAADAAGLRTELMFTNTPPAPLWTANALGPRGAAAWVRIRRAGTKRYFELPIADNTTNTITVDTLGITVDIQPGDDVEILTPGAYLRGATTTAGTRLIAIRGEGGFPVAAASTDQGATFERIGFRCCVVLGKEITFDRCSFTGDLGGLESLIVRYNATCSCVNCSSHDRGVHVSLGGSHIDEPIWNSRPDAAADPAVTVPITCLMAKHIAIDVNGTFLAAYPVSCYGDPNDGISVQSGGFFVQLNGCAYVGGDSSAGRGISCRNAGQVLVRGDVNTRITGTMGDLYCDGVDCAYGTVAGQFEEVAGYNGNLHNTTITVGGQPTGGMSRIYVD